VKRSSSLVDRHGHQLELPDGLRKRGDAEYWGTAYRGASLTSRELSSWLPSWRSADAELLPELSTLVARSRDLDRNHGLAWGGIQALLDNIIGVGLRLNARPNYVSLGLSKSWAEGWSRDVEAAWRDYAATTAVDAAGELTFHELTSLVLRTVLTSGDAVALPLWLEQAGRPWATAVQLIDPDRLSNPGNGPDRANLRRGIEIDRLGAPVGYWVRSTHPGDYYTGEPPAGPSWARIPASTWWGRRTCLHIRERTRVGQSRGAPLLAPVLATFHMLDLYERSELQAAVVNAMIAAFIETPLDQDSILQLIGEDEEAYLQKRKEWTPRLKGGSILPIFPGDKLSPFTPNRPSSAYDGFTNNILRRIGATLGLPLELLTKDFSQTNYSSARAAMLEARRLFMSRRQWLGSAWASPVYELWLEEAVERRLVDAPSFYAQRSAWARCEWIGPGTGAIDQLKEAQAQAVRLKSGTTTFEQIYAEAGGDWEEAMEQRAREKARMAELGITPADLAPAELEPAREEAANA
jgi:lambda family phage portal protein